MTRLQQAIIEKNHQVLKITGDVCAKFRRATSMSLRDIKQADLSKKTKPLSYRLFGQTVF